MRLTAGAPPDWHEDNRGAAAATRHRVNILMACRETEWGRFLFIRIQGLVNLHWSIAVEKPPGKYAKQAPAEKELEGPSL
jgi:hypothetical protein